MNGSVISREITFGGPHELHDQAPVARALLADSPVIRDCVMLGPNVIRVEYDLQVTCMIEIESALQELGFHLDNTLMSRLRRAYYAYREGTVRANMQNDPHCIGHCARRIFVQCYRNTEHGCRDSRPRHWRDYR